MNPIRGVVPISPTRTVGESGIQHDAVDQKLENERSTWYKEATKYIKERIKPESRYKLKKYIEDPTLNKIRYDRTLFHLPHSVGSYVDAKTGKRTSNGKNAKHTETVSKVRRCGSRCIHVLTLLIQTTRMLKFLNQQQFVQRVLCLYATKDWE